MVHVFSVHLLICFKALFDAGNIDYTHFIRTTDETHKRLVQSIWVKHNNKTAM